MTRSLITGVTGQDGSYLAELLVERGDEVWGLARDVDAARAHPRLATVASKVRFVAGDLTDETSVVAAVSVARPDEVYNLAAFSSVGRSWAEPELVRDLNARGIERLIEAVLREAPGARLFQASSSDMFGSSEAPQDEATALDPESPYAEAKRDAHEAVAAARAGGLFACSGILFNHESPRRSEQFVTRKITLAVARIEAGLQETLELGNLEPRRDWGFAGEYVEAMVAMLAAPEPRDYVIGTGVAHSVRDFVELAFTHAGLSAEDHIRVDADLVRPADSPELRADPALIERELGWRARTMLPELVGAMVDADRERVAAGT